MQRVDPQLVLGQLVMPGPCTAEAMERCGDLAAVCASLPQLIVERFADSEEFFEPPLLTSLIVALVRRRARDEATYGPMARCATAIGLSVAMATLVTEGRLPMGAGIGSRKRSALSCLLARIGGLMPAVPSLEAEVILGDLRPLKGDAGRSSEPAVQAVSAVLGRIESTFASAASDQDAVEALAGSVVESLWALRGH